MIVDVNVNLSRWPFRRLPCDETPELVEKLKACGVTQAWAGSFDGLLHRDVAAVNARLADECRAHGPDLLVPFGSVNPKLPDWQEDLRRVAEDYRMPGVRVYPNYHGYALEDPAFVELLGLAEQRGLILGLVVRMEDPRTHHPLVMVPDCDLRPLPGLLAERPKLRLVVLNGLRATPGAALVQLAQAGNVYFEISQLEGVAGITGLLRSVPVEQILFGSHFPLFYLESALLKLRESALPAAQLEALLHGNAERLMQG